MTKFIDIFPNNRHRGYCPPELMDGRGAEDYCQEEEKYSVRGGTRKSA